MGCYFVEFWIRARYLHVVGDYLCHSFTGWIPRYVSYHDTPGLGFVLGMTYEV